MSKQVTLSHRLEYLAMMGFRHSIGALPLTLSTDISGTAARVIGVRTSLRKRGARNLAFAMPELSAQERDVILSGMFDSLARTAIEYRHLKRLMHERERIEIIGQEHLEAARHAGRGALLATGHFGNWEVIRLACARFHWPPALIYRAFNNPLFDRFAQSMMAEIDAPLFHKGRKGALGFMRHVLDGGSALILTDQRFSRAPEIPFFGRPAPTSLGAAEIAQKNGAALLPVRGERIGRESRFQVVIEAPLDTSNDRSAVEITAELNQRLEGWVRKKPEQYFWMHNRWGKAALRSVNH